MEDNAGDLLVLDHPYCNEYYEYAVKQRILENMVWQGENVSQQLNLIEGRLREQEIMHLHLLILQISKK